MGIVGVSSDADSKSLDSAGGGGNHHHNSQPFRLVYRITVLFTAATLACLVLYHSANTFQFLPTSVYNPSPSSSTKETELEKVLKGAAMEDKTVIITTVNEAWAAPHSILDLFLESFRIGNQTIGLLNHLVMVAMDQKAYARCLAIHPHCYALTTAGVDFSGEAHFMSGNYLTMMWRRIDFLHTVLSLGYTFIFSDVDIMWFRDPFPRFYPDADFQIACDGFNGNPYDLNNRPNGGFNYVKSNNRTIQFYKFWYNSSKSYPGLHDQDVLNRIKNHGFIREIGLSIRFLDTAYFGGFCEPSRDFNVVCTMHANCCVGLDKKVHDLRLVLEDWTTFMASTNTTAPSHPFSWRAPQNCRHSSFQPP